MSILNMNKLIIKKYIKNKSSANIYIIICILLIILLIIIFYYIKKKKENMENINNMENQEDKILIVPSVCIGFFACCAHILKVIIDDTNNNNIIPKKIDTSQQFKIYKPSNIQGDITTHFFKKRDDFEIKYIEFIKCEDNMQYLNYSNINYTPLTPFIEKYFSPSQEIVDIENKLIQKYNINVNDYCAVYYRGTDKKEETTIGSFDTYIDKMNEMLNTDKNIKFIIQSDNTDFIDIIKSKFSNSISFDENVSSKTDKGVHNENTPEDNYIIMKNFLAIVYLMAKCKYIICSSGNCSIWIMLFRGNGQNVKQFLNNEWL